MYGNDQDLNSLKRVFMKDTIFRTYDIRGKVGIDFVLDEVYALGRALAAYLIKRHGALRTIILGMDGRTHSPQIKEDLTKAFLESGIDVIFIGVCPTPLVYFALQKGHGDAGVMITASHNGPEYNGLKICCGNDVIWGDELSELRRWYRLKKSTTAQIFGEYSELYLHETYVDWICEHFAHLRGMKYSLVIDCGNGATGTLIPRIVQKMGWEDTYILYAEVDGTCPHHEADPVIEENMHDVKKILTTTNAQIGIGFDGDGDRMCAMTKSGILLSGDQLLALLSKPVTIKHPGCSIIYDAKSSSIVPALLTQWGARPHMSPAGHSIIKAEIKKHQALLAGELSCHFFFNDRYFGYDDGIYAALRLCEVIELSGKTLDELFAELPKTYATSEVRIACDDELKDEVVASLTAFFTHVPDTELSLLDGVRITWAYGWCIVRASRTQPVLSVRCEADTAENLERIKGVLYDFLLSYFNEDALEFIKPRGS